MTGSTSVVDFLAKLTVHTTEVAGSVAAFGSGALGDRLLLDGPVYTCFLAIVHILCGAVNTTDYANNSPIFSIANSIIDALSCVLVLLCGRLAFGRKAGLIAALLLSVYPASVLNTRLCYSELFVYFLLLLWSTAALALSSSIESSKRVASCGLSFTLGAVSVFLLLAKSFFAPLPVLGLFIVLGQKDIFTKGKTLFPCLATMIAGAAIVMAPWLWFTHEITGRFTPWVNRAPGYNLFVGNQLYTDGWRTWPAQDGIPNEASEAFKSLGKNFAGDPAQFSALQLRKISRLWAGVWNDFQHRFFGIGWQAQNVFHDLILTFAAIGFILSFKETSQKRRAALVFSVFATYHSLYAGFEPVARYAVSAMPFACLLAGAALAGLADPLRNKRFWTLLFFSAGFFTALDKHFSLIPQLFSALPTEMWTPVALLDGAVWLCLWSGLAVLVLQVLEAPNKLQRLAVWLMAFTLGTISAANLAYDPARTEWSAMLKKSGDGVSADIVLPNDIKNPPAIAYLLVDMQADMPAPQVTVTVNEKNIGAPLPVLQLMKDRSDASEIFALQAQAMMVDPRSYRGWWAFPVPITYLSPNTPNKISILAKSEEGIEFSPVRVFGSYPTTDEELNLSKTVGEDGAPPTAVSSILLPSINKFSWVKGFVTIDRRDPRPYERFSVKGAVRNCQLHAQHGDDLRDLSGQWGRQFGAYRMRLYLPPDTIPPFDLGWWSPDSEELFTKKEEVLILGGDPNTMSLTTAPVPVPAPIGNGAFYSFSCELEKTKQTSIGAITIIFSGVGNDGREVTFSSPWTPTALTLEKNGWQKFSFVDRVPENIRNAHDVKAKIMISPFAADRLFLHKKNALRDSVKARNISLRLIKKYAPPLSPINEAYLY